MSSSGRNTVTSSSMAVVLQLDEEVVAAEDVLEARRRFERGLLVARQDQLRDEPAEAAGRRGDALVVTLEQLPVAARLVVVAVEVRAARDLDEVAVALVGLGEHREVEDLVLGALRPVEARRVGEVALHAEHRLDAGVARGRVHRERAVHVPVVGDADRGLAVGGDRRDDVADPRRTVEHRVLGVQMQMDERIASALISAVIRRLRSGLSTRLWISAYRPLPSTGRRRAVDSYRLSTRR